MTSLRILIADDNEMFQDLIALFLRGLEGVEIVGTARNGEEAIQAVEQHHPDVVVIDLNMPYDGATKAPKIIKEKYPVTRVILCSAYPEEALQASVTQLQADGYISKAVLKAGLMEMVKKEMERKK